MDAFQQITLHKKELTITEQQVANAVIANPEDFLQSTTTMVAQYAGVSQSTVSRFAQKIGYESFTDFRMNLMLSLSSNTPQDKITRKDDSVEYLCDMIQATKKSLKPGSIDQLTKKILSSHHVFTTGAGLSEPPALMLSLELLKYNIPSYFMQSGQEMIHMHIASQNDLLIIFSSKNDTQRMLLTVLQEMPENQKPYILMISHSPLHPLRQFVNEFIVLPTWQTERYPVYLEPITSTLAFCNILMISVSQQTGNDPKMLPPFISGKRHKTSS